MIQIRNALLVLPVLLLAGCSIIYPYELTVTVVSLDDGTPIPGITINLLSENNEVTTGVTDQFGVCILKAHLDHLDFRGGPKGDDFLHGDKEKPWRVSINYLNNDFVVRCPASPRPTKGTNLVAASMVVAVKKVEN